METKRNIATLCCLILAAALIGFGVYLFTLGRIISRAVAGMVMIAKNALLILGKVIKKVLGVLCGVTYFRNLREKFKETPCAESDQ